MTYPAKFKWLHSLRTCCLSGREDIHIAHLHEIMLTSFNQKVPDIYVLPLARALHDAQHKIGPKFWTGVFPGENPVAEAAAWAERLHDIWEARDLEGADLLFRDMQEKANRAYLAQFLQQAA